MPFLELLASERVRTDLVATNKSDLFDRIAGMLAINAEEKLAILEALTTREKLGSTGLGRGVAIPHGRIAGVDKARVAFIRLATPLDFASLDAIPVDLIAALVVPAHFTDQHLQMLAELAELFSNHELTAALRNAEDASALHAELAKFAANRLRDCTWID